MNNILEYIWGAFQRLFVGLSGGNFTDIALTDLSVVTMVIVLPVLTIAVVIGHQKN